MNAASARDRKETARKNKKKGEDDKAGERQTMANVDEDLLRAAEEGNYDEMLTLLENGASVHYVGDMGW